jgi:UrcA family protein
MERIMIRPIIFTALVLAAGTALAGVGAQATAFDRPQTRVVHYGDLDLSTDRGIRTLYRRIEIAARAVCGEAERPESLLPTASFRSCTAGAIDSAVAKISRPALTAYYERGARVRGDT